MGQPSSHALQHHIRVTARALIVCSRRTDAAAPQNLHRSGSRSRSTVKTYHPAVTMRAGPDPTTNCQTAGGRWRRRLSGPHQISRTPLRAFLRRFAPAGLSTRPGLRLTCRVLEPLSELGEPFHLGLEGANTLIAGAVWAGEQAARGTHRDQLRRNVVFLLHGCLSPEQLACRQKQARIAADLSTAVDSASECRTWLCRLEGRSRRMPVLQRRCGLGASCRWRADLRCDWRYALRTNIDPDVGCCRAAANHAAHS